MLESGLGKQTKVGLTFLSMKYFHYSTLHLAVQPISNWHSLNALDSHLAQNDLQRKKLKHVIYYIISKLPMLSSSTIDWVIAQNLCSKAKRDTPHNNLTLLIETNSSMS